MSNIYRKTYAEINLPNLYQNYKTVSNLNKDITIIPVVKANAYGHGSIDVVQYLHRKGVTFFAVSLIEEALELREVFPNIDIIIMGVLDKVGFVKASDEKFIVTCSNFDQIDELLTIKKKIKLHLKIDTGMNRLGFKSLDDINKAVLLLSKNSNCILHGIYTHFSTADCNEQYFIGQRDKFDNIVEQLSSSFEMIHVSNSSSLFKYDSAIDYTTHGRLGISLYGLTLDEGIPSLKNTYKLKTKISEIKNIKQGDSVGYGATYTANEDEIIGILPIGYADGFIRKNQGGYVEINEKRYEIIGRICMDQTFIRIDDTITKNQEVILFGGIITIDEVARRLETINYEVICQITSRVPKIYVK